MQNCVIEDGIISKDGLHDRQCHKATVGEHKHTGISMFLALKTREYNCKKICNNRQHAVDSNTDNDKLNDKGLIDAGN